MWHVEQIPVFFPPLQEELWRVELGLVLLLDGDEGLCPVKPLSVLDQPRDVSEVRLLRVVSPTRGVVFLRRQQSEERKENSSFRRQRIASPN